MSGLTEAKSLKVTPWPSTWGVLVSQDQIFRHDELTQQAGSQNMQKLTGSVSVCYEKPNGLGKRLLDISGNWS